MEITKVTIGDLDQIIDIEKKFFDGREFYNKASLINMLGNKDVIFFKACESNKILGYLIAYYLTDHIDLYQIAVDRSQQRKHIASKLEAKLNEYKLPVCVEVSQANIGAVAFYEKNGYSIIKVLNNYYENNSPALLMRKEYGKGRN